MLGIREGAGITIFRQNCFVSQYRKNFVGEPFGVSENFWYRKTLCFRGICHDFPSKIFCLTVPKNFVGEPFIVSLISGIEKFYASDGYVTIFCRKFFVSVPKNSLGEPFSVSLISGIEKFYASEVYVTIFCRNFFVSQCRKIS